MEFKECDKLKEVKNIKDAEDARQLAIDWQSWASEQLLSTLELSIYQGYFRTIAVKFNLLEEFEENGII